MMDKHLVFYDGSCGLCDHVVQFLLKHDHKGIFLFAPLQGSTALSTIQKLPEEYKRLDSLILLENYQSDHQESYVLGQGAFRILWLLGGPWKLLGWISYLPPILYNWGYRLVASNRHHFFSAEKCILPDEKNKNRFLP